MKYRVAILIAVKNLSMQRLNEKKSCKCIELRLSFASELIFYEREISRRLYDNRQ
jgi:hypothetical protein